MKVTELQIGDYIRINRTKEIVWVFEIDGDRNVINNESDGYCSEKNINIDDIEPIPITPEILRKSGFILKSDGWLWCEEEGIDEKNYIFIQFRKGCGDVRLVELNFVNKVLAKYEHIHYIHELQHALRLCGLSELADNLKLEE